MLKNFFRNSFISAKDEVSGQPVEAQNVLQQEKLAFLDQDFLLREELRPVRLQLELLKPELIQKEQGIEATVVVFGSARIAEAAEAAEKVSAAEKALLADPNNLSLQQAVTTAKSLQAKSPHYEAARKFAKIVAKAGQVEESARQFIVTGGGPGIMEAANRGAHDVGAKSIAVGIVLPMEEKPNPYVTPELTFKFHYFALRKMHFLMRARAVVAFPGGFGTLDELFETLTLMQTRKIHRMPVLLYDKAYWEGIINFQAMVDQGVVSPKDLELIRYVDEPQQAWDEIVHFYQEA